jgi:hypothetical protein
LAVTLGSGETSRTLALCGPCRDALQLWLTGARQGSKRGPREGKSRSEVIEALISRRRARSLAHERHARQSERVVIFWTVCAFLVGVGLLGLLATVAALTGESAARRR